jgi:hypothetical protein
MAVLRLVELNSLYHLLLLLDALPRIFQPLIQLPPHILHNALDRMPNFIKYPLLLRLLLGRCRLNAGDQLPCFGGLQKKALLVISHGLVVLALHD